MTPALPILFVSLSTLPMAVEAPESVCDRVVLRDGTTILGQVVPSRAARVELIVRRAWAEEHLPDLAATWIRLEQRTRQRAHADRVDRLRRWRQERQSPPNAADPIASWIDQELERLDRSAEDDPTPLMVVRLDRRDVARVDPQPEDRRRMLRQGWRAGFEDVESMPPDRLVAGLQARGFALSDIDPAPIDDLLPMPVESDRRWLARRASTEVQTDPGLRFVRFGNLVLPDPEAGAAIDQSDVTGAVGNLLGGLLGNGPVRDPIVPLLEQIEASGRIGAIVTQLEIAPGYDRVAVETVLLVRTRPSRWEPAARRRSEVRPADLPADAGQPLADDPQVRAAFNLLEGLGVGRVDPQAQRLGLAVGAATQVALQEARSALDADLNSARLRLDRAAAAAPEPEPR